MVHVGSTCLEMWPFRKIIVLVAVVVRHPAFTLYPSFDCNYTYCVIACSVIETNYHRVSNGYIYTIHSESSNLQTKQLKHKLPCYEYKHITTEMFQVPHSRALYNWQHLIHWPYISCSVVMSKWGNGLNTAPRLFHSCSSGNCTPGSRFYCDLLDTLGTHIIP